MFPMLNKVTYNSGFIWDKVPDTTNSIQEANPITRRKLMAARIPFGALTCSSKMRLNDLSLHLSVHLSESVAT